MMTRYTYRYDNMTKDEIAKDIYEEITNAFRAKYGDRPDYAIVRRVSEEWDRMMDTCTIGEVAALHELTEWLKSKQYPYRIRGCTGSSFILYLLGISSGNPLPPHRYCPRCGDVTWVPRRKNGFDIPQGKCCSHDGARLVTDGHDIPWQTLFGYSEHRPSFDIDLPYELYETLKREWETHWLRDKSTFREVEYESDIVDCVRVIKLGRLSVCFILNAASPDFYKYEYGALERRYMLDNAVGLIELRDKGYPAPKSIADLLAGFGIDHATGVWDSSCREMLAEDYTLSDIITLRDDVYRLLTKYGMDKEEAWRVMERVRKGKRLQGANLPEMPERDMRVLDQCWHIDYLYPKAHAVEHILFRLRARDW